MHHISCRNRRSFSTPVPSSPAGPIAASSAAGVSLGRGVGLPRRCMSRYFLLGGRQRTDPLSAAEWHCGGQPQISIARFQFPIRPRVSHMHHPGCLVIFIALFCQGSPEPRMLDAAWFQTLISTGQNIIGTTSSEQRHESLLTDLDVNCCSHQPEDTHERVSALRHRRH